MAITVLDSTNLAGILADAAGEEQPAIEKQPAAAVEKQADAGADAGQTADPAHDDDADDQEGDDGLTPRQKRELSAKMLKAIGKKHRQVREAEEFAADQIRLARDAQREADELREQIKKATPAAKPAPEVVEPKRENFATEQEFIDARVAWGVEQGIKKAREQAAQAAREAGMQAQYRAAAKLVPDFEQTVNKPLDWPAGVVDYLQESDMFAELGYHFAKHPDELAKLSAMSPTRRLVALGKIEGTLSPFAAPKAAKDGDKPDADPPKAAASTTDGITPSKARSDAPVIKPLSSSSGRAVDPDPREMTTREAIAEFQRQKGLNLTRRQRH